MLLIVMQASQWSLEGSIWAASKKVFFLFKKESLHLNVMPQTAVFILMRRRGTSLRTEPTLGTLPGWVVSEERSWSLTYLADLPSLILSTSYYVTY